ncbi:ribonuclease H-like domain-containing protein [Tanacetum coccineum]
MVPRTVLSRSGPISVNTVRPVNTVQPRTVVNNVGAMKNVINNAYSTARRPFNKITTANNSNFTKNINTVKGTRVNTARPKAVLSTVKGNKGNTIKASACWVWRPKHKILDHVSRNNGASLSFKIFNYIDAQGRSKHMIGNRSYLTDYEEIDGGFVAFGGNSKRGKITRKDFKLTEESHVLLNVPRKDNMYSVDLKNDVPLGGLTCLFAKATPDEFNLWHKRLGHINFKTMNKLGIYVARTLQQNGVAERKNRTLIKAARTMLADSKFPTTFWAEKTCLKLHETIWVSVTILNTIDHLGKFDGKADEGFFVGYFTNSKTYRVFNSRTRIVEENLHVKFSKNTPNIAGSGPNWIFDIDALTKSMNYKPVTKGNKSNGNAGTKECDTAGKARMEIVPGKDYILLPLWTQDPSFSTSLKDSPNVGCKPSGEEEKKGVEDPGNEDSEVPSTKEPRVNKEMDNNVNNTNTVNAASINEVNAVSSKTSIELPDDPNMTELEDIVYSDDDEDVGA